jgi:predicted DNA repair protein MutK
MLISYSFSHGVAFMASGLLILLDDIAVLARATASSFDDILLGAGRASAKSAGILIDDAAVTPGYVMGLSPKRELPVVGKITLGSLRNKFLLVIPAILLLSAFAPWVFPYLLIIGGAYLVYEGAEKVLGWLGHGHSSKHLEAVSGDAAGEKRMVSSAVRTDLVLSIEIMLISLSALELQDNNWLSQLLALSLIALLMTALVYGAVALLVKMDDIGLHLALTKTGGLKKFGHGLVKAMPGVFKGLSVVGTIAMLWVGGHLLWKSLGDVGMAFAADTLHAVEAALHPFGGLITWLGDTAISAVIGLAGGLVIVGLLTPVKRLLRKRKGTQAAH